MHGTRYQRSQPRTAAPAGPPMYWGWSHQNARMEMMDLPNYMDSFRQGYDQAFADIAQRLQANPRLYGVAAAPGETPTAMATVPVGSPQAYASGPGPWGSLHHRRHGHHGHHDCGCEHHEHHGHCCEHHEHCCEHEHHEHHDCGCEHEHHEHCCECCIDECSDVVVYAHCGEVRVVPIAIENDTRKVREDVTFEVSEVRSGGGRVLPWRAILRPDGPLTIEPCSTARLELVVHVACESKEGAAEPANPGRKATGRDAPRETVNPGLIRIVEGGDVDRCEVGYATIRVGGCLVRPIVVAVAALPLSCGRYHVDCGCSCCC